MKVNNMQNVQYCKERLKFLDYLRKSQCTKSFDGRDRSNHPYHATHKPNECDATLNLLEEAAKECSEIRKKI